MATALTVALIIKLALAWSTGGTLDVRIWTQFVRDVLAEGVGVYRRPYKVTFFNHPPFMIHVCLWWSWLQEVTGISLRFWIRAFSILADIGSFSLLYRMVLRRQPDGLPSRAFTKSMMLWMCAPVALVISGFHGNTDSVMIFFFLLCVFLIENEYSITLAGFALGLSLCIKVTSILFIPVLFFYLGWRRFMLLLLTAAPVFVILGLPYIAQDTAFLLGQIFGYKSVYGWWGISRILTMWGTDSMDWLNIILQHHGTKILLSLVIIASIWMNRLPRRPQLYEQCAMILLIFFTFTPGFATQYFAWVLPFVLALSWYSQIAFHITTALYLGFAYSAWWYYGVSGSHPLLYGTRWGNGAMVTELLCWFTFVVLTYQHWSHLRRMEDKTDAIPPLNVAGAIS